MTGLTETTWVSLEFCPQPEDWVPHSPFRPLPSCLVPGAVSHLVPHLSPQESFCHAGALPSPEPPHGLHVGRHHLHSLRCQPAMPMTPSFLWWACPALRPTDLFAAGALHSSHPTSVTLAIGLPDANPLTCTTFHQSRGIYGTRPPSHRVGTFVRGFFCHLFCLYPLEYKG